MRVFRKFRASDGRIKIATLSGVSALVAVIALLMGVLPVFASQPGVTGEEVNPVQVEWGGGSGACDDVLTPVNGGDDRGPSAAEHELHVNNPVPGTTTTYTGPDETQITLTVDANDEFFEFSIEAGTGIVVYDVVVNGGKKSNHYGYDDASKIVPSDSHLSAPTKDNKDDEVHKLSHVNICYDVVTFECDTPVTLEGEGLITSVTAEIFTNSVDDTFDCSSTKESLYFIDNDTVTLDFGDDGEADVVGRLDFTKDFGDPDLFDDLTYDGPGEFVDLQWCEIRTPKATGDGDQFDDVLADDEYPSLDEVTDTFTDSDNNTVTVAATACKVSEEENAAGVQHTVVYFEFEDPNFR